jgi:hypothetical protein
LTAARASQPVFLGLIPNDRCFTCRISRTATFRVAATSITALNSPELLRCRGSLCKERVLGACLECHGSRLSSSLAAAILISLQLTPSRATSLDDSYSALPNAWLQVTSLVIARISAHARADFSTRSMLRMRLIRRGPEFQPPRLRTRSRSQLVECGSKPFGTSDLCRT